MPPKAILAKSSGNGARSKPAPARKAASSLKSKPPVITPLAKGQLWKMDDKHVEIMEVGKTLTHYRLFQNQKRVPISLGGIVAVQAFLRRNKAVLIREAAPGNAT